MCPSILIPFSFRPALLISISSSLPPLSLPPPYFWSLFCPHSYFVNVLPPFPLHTLLSFYASPLPFLSFFLPTTTSAMCLYALGDLCIDTYICSFYAASVLFFFAFTTSLFYHISLSIPFTAASHSTTAPFYSFY